MEFGGEDRGERSIRVLVKGPLASVADDLREELGSQGYTPRSISDYLRLVSQLSRWLQDRGLTAEDLTESVAREFFQLRKSRGRRKSLTSRSVSVLLACLQIDRLPDGLVGGVPFQALLMAYRGYLLNERGLSNGTVTQYLRQIRAFLAWLPDTSDESVARVSAEQVTTFVMDWCPRRGSAEAKMMVTALRSFLRFLHVHGVCPDPLVNAVPSVAARRGAGLARAVGADQVARILAACDRSRPGGLRDYAVIMLMVRLGLRAGEVAGLRLADVDWPGGQMTVRGKGSRLDMLPLPVDVGEAMADYLQHARPRRPVRPYLFVCTQAPFGPLHTNTIISIVHRACERAGIARFGPHRLRHAVACDLLAHGASLEEIGQLLRHSEQSTTSQYARVDLARLGELVVPSPIGAIR